MKKQLPFFIAILGLSVAGLSQEQEPLATPEIIFRDTFDRASTTFDVNEVASERQVGRVAPLNYTESGETASGGILDDLTQIGHVDYPGTLASISLNGATLISPEHNFVESGSFTVEFDVHPGANLPGHESPDWAEIVIGASQRNRFVNASDGVGILFRNNLAIQVFDGQTSIYGSAAGALPPDTFHVRLDVESPGFEGSGDATIRLFVDGEPFGLTAETEELVKAGGFSSNNITLGGFDSSGLDTVHTFDNFQIAGLTCVEVGPALSLVAGGAEGELTITVPAPFLETGGVNVTVASPDPSIASLVGGANGSLTVAFAQGGPAKQTVSLQPNGAGVARLEVSNDANLCVAGGVEVIVAAPPTLAYSDDFETGDLNAFWQVSDRPFEAGTSLDGYVEVGPVNSLDIIGTVSDDYWGGRSVATGQTFSADKVYPLVIEVDRVLDGGVASATRSGIWITDQSRSQYILFTQNVGEGGWQYNRLIGEPGDSPTGTGVNIEAFDFLDEDYGQHRMRIEADGENVRLFLDDELGAVVPFPVSEGIVFELAAYGRQNGDLFFAAFDNVEIYSAGPTGLPCVALSPSSVNTFVESSFEATVSVPGLILNEKGVEVTLSSSDPEVVALSGADADGNLTLNFARGGSNTQTITLQSSHRGGAVITGVTDAPELCVLSELNVTVFAGLVRDPSFELTPRPGGVGYGPIIDWMGGSGINDGGPFGDNGVIPDQSQIAFSQGSATIAQEIRGLVPGEDYWLQFRYNRRACCGESTIGFAVTLDGVEIGRVDLVEAVGGANPYHEAHFGFAATSDVGLLEIAAMAEGDATLLLDAVTIVQRDAGNVVLDNPSFEASGPVAFPGYIEPGSLAGWVGDGGTGVNVSGVGPFANNGANRDQDLVAFIQGNASLRQSVDRFIVGEEYLLSFAYNARADNAPHLQVRVGDQVLFDEDVVPVGGREPYYQAEITFTAEAGKADIIFQQTAAGDNTVLVDDVILIGETATIDCIEVDRNGFDLTVGQTGSEITLTASPGLLELAPIDVEVRSLDPTIAQVDGVNDEGVLTIRYEPGDDLVKTLKFSALAKGMAQLELSSPQSVVCFSDALIAVNVTAAIIKNAGFESSPPANFPTYGPIEHWDGSANFGVNNPFVDNRSPFHDNGIVPDGRQVGFVQVNNHLSQTIGGLDTSKDYWLQFYYNVRNCCPPDGGPPVDFRISFAGNVLFEEFGVSPVGTVQGEDPYNFVSVPFRPTASSGEFRIDVMVEGDGSLTFDAFQIIQRDSDDVLIVNPSFESSAPVPAPGYLSPDYNLAGWDASGGFGVNLSGVGPFANNGVNPDQDAVVFLQGAGSSISQLIEGLTPGDPYTLSYAYNARNGNTPKLRVDIDGEVLQEASVTPVGGANPYRENFVTFRPAADAAVLTFAQAAEGDQTLLLDDIRIKPGETLFVPCVIVDPVHVSASVGQIGNPVEVTMTPQALAGGDVTVTITSADPTIASPAAAEEGALALVFTSDGPLTQSFEIEALAGGTTAFRMESDSELCFESDMVVVDVSSALLINAGFEVSALPAPPGYGAILGWNQGGGTGLNGSAGPFLDNGEIPDRNQAAFLQGSTTLSQSVFGLEPGEVHWLQFWYNARNCCGGTLNLITEFNGEVLDTIENVTPVGAGMPFNVRSVAFVPDGNAGELTFRSQAEGDASAVLDAVTIIRRSADDALIYNPSFETSGDPEFPGYMKPAKMAGWVFEGEGNFGVNLSGKGPFADNGTNPEQPSVAFIQGLGSLSQTLSGLHVGAEYVIRFAFNARGGNAPQLQVQFGEDVVYDESVSPVGEDAAYQIAELPVTATSEDVLLSFAQTAAGDNTVLLDQVQLIQIGGGSGGLALSVIQLDGAVRVSWPESMGNVMLQRASDITGPWEVVEGELVAEGGVVSLDLPADQAQGFYRAVSN